MLSADQRFRMGRPEGKSKASLVSTFRLDLMTTALALSLSPFGLGTDGLPALGLRFALRKTAFRVMGLRLALRATERVVFLVGFFAIVNSPMRRTDVPGFAENAPAQAFPQLT